MATLIAPNQYLVVRLTDDERNYTYWIQDSVQPLVMRGNMPVEPPQATRTTSAATMGTNIQTSLPTLST